MACRRALGFSSIFKLWTKSYITTGTDLVQYYKYGLSDIMYLVSTQF